jgi:hypothetical protein
LRIKDQSGIFTLEYFLIFFILLQPLIDLLTSVSIFVLDINITFGVFIRLGVMVLIVLYVFFSKSKYKKVMSSYLVILGLTYIIGFIVNLYIKDSLSIFSELRNIAKISYVPIVLFGYIVVFEKINKNFHLQSKFLRNIFVSMLVVVAVMVLATITNTGISSYGSGKVGHQGWFFAGNEVGAILAINLGIVMFFAVSHTTSWKRTYYWIPVVLMIFSMLQLGTKVGYGASLIILIVVFVMNIFEYIKNRKKLNVKNSFKVNTILTTITLGLFVLYSPFTPVFANTNTHLSWVGLDKEEETAEKPKKEVVQAPKEEKKKIDQKAVENVIFSGREAFLERYKTAYKEAPLAQKLFGMGQGGNNINKGHPIEMDFYDIFFSLGVIGFIIYVLPFIYIFYRIFLALIMNLSEKFNIQTVLFGSSIILGLGIAFTAGHVLTAPAVSFYLVILIAWLFNLTISDGKK